MTLRVCLRGVCVVWLHLREAATHSTHASFSRVCVCEKRGSQNSEERRATEKEEEEEEEGSAAKISLCVLTYGSEESMIEKSRRWR